MIEVNERVDVAAPPQVVWELLSDPHAVVNCVNGATLGEQHEDGTFDAGMVVKFGPAKVTFNTRIALELDPATRTGNVSAKGKDNQGGTRVRATMKFGVVETADPPGSSISITAEVEVGGKLAHLVESGAEFVVKRMTTDFSERLAEVLAKAPVQ
ncbi:MAG: SRPBCC family protein [Betaproteobacteria bacterium]|nr:SRPBCC family protein [Betaproteobacteria bacterium]